MGRGAQARKGNGEITFFTPYDANFIADIKAIPWQYRAWDKDERGWTVHEPYCGKGLEIFYNHYPYGTVHEYVPPPPPPPAEPSLPPSGSPHAILRVLPTAPPEVIRAAYRALAKLYHPDVNPGERDEANRAMQRINWALEQLVEEDSK